MISKELSKLLKFPKNSKAMSYLSQVIEDNVDYISIFDFVKVTGISMNHNTKRSWRLLIRSLECYLPGLLKPESFTGLPEGDAPYYCILDSRVIYLKYLLSGKSMPLELKEKLLVRKLFNKTYIVDCLSRLFGLSESDSLLVYSVLDKCTEVSRVPGMLGSKIAKKIPNYKEDRVTFFDNLIGFYSYL